MYTADARIIVRTGEDSDDDAGWNDLLEADDPASNTACSDSPNVLTA